MAFKSKIWYPIAFVLSAVNLAAVGFAAASTEPWHATIHAGLALAFGSWAHHLRERRPGGSDQLTRLETLEFEVSEMRQELSEAQERLDFTERMLAKEPEPRRVGPEA